VSFFTELNRRNVFRVAIAYLAAAWLLIEVAGTLFPGFGIPDWAFRFVVIILAIGFLPTLIFSWAYEVTSEGLKRETEVVREASITHLTAKRLDGITIALIVAALLFIVIDRLWLNSRLVGPRPSVAENVIETEEGSRATTIGPQITSNSIAVMPFVNMSPDPDNEYFADGLSEELLNVLARIEGLNVAGRTSSFHFKGSNPDLREVGNILGVAYILEGSVRKQGNQIRVTAQLVQASDGFHIWSDTYDFQLNDIFAVQDELAEQVADALQTRLIGEKLPTEVTLKKRNAPNIDAETYSLYLQALAQFGLRTLEGQEAAFKLLEQVTDRAPEFAEGWAALSDVTLLLHNNHGTISWSDAKTIATPAVANALALAPDTSVVQTAWAHYNSDLLSKDGYQPAREVLIRAFEYALELNPQNPEALYWYAGFWESSNERKYERALALLERALAVDQLKIIARQLKTVALHALGRIEEARDYTLQSLHLFPKAAFLYVLLARIEESRGRLDHAWLWLEKGKTANPLWMYDFERLYVAKALRYEAGMHDAVTPISGNPYFQPTIKAFFQVREGATAKAIATLEKAADELGPENFNQYIGSLKATIGDCAGALEVYAQGHDDNIYDDAESLLDQLYHGDSSHVAYCMKITGQIRKSQAIAKAIVARTDWVDDAPPFSGEAPDFQMARLAALCVLGEEELALQRLEAYISGGQRNLWKSAWVEIDKDPRFQLLHNNPQFIKLVDEVRAGNNRMLNAVLSGKVVLEDMP